MAHSNGTYGPPVGAMLCDRLFFPGAPGANVQDGGRADEKALQDLSTKK
eukprot:COSAG02_NODE_44634_length_364_cov_0.981132_1_plen_48_part_10